ncbi:MAG: TIGR04086 family membrane protein [Oscillospiraceae bacterium]|nr:TIGR04086 family membrane protein [Oscillospiraceae bacterium]
MIRNSKVTGKATSAPIGILVGLMVSLAVMISCSMVLAVMMVGGGLSVKTIGWWALAVVSSSSILGALTTGFLVKRRVLIMCMAEGMGYFASLLVINISFFGGTYVGVWAVLISTVLTSAAVGVVLARVSDRRGGRYPKRRYR